MKLGNIASAVALVVAFTRDLSWENPATVVFMHFTEPDEVYEGITKNFKQPMTVFVKGKEILKPRTAAFRFFTEFTLCKHVLRATRKARRQTVRFTAFIHGVSDPFPPSSVCSSSTSEFSSFSSPTSTASSLRFLGLQVRILVSIGGKARTHASAFSPPACSCCTIACNARTIAPPWHAINHNNQRYLRCNLKVACGRER